jgi:hypothetical protein
LYNKWSIGSNAILTTKNKKRLGRLKKSTYLCETKETNMKRVPSIKSKVFKSWCKNFEQFDPCSFSSFNDEVLYEIFILGYK